MKVRVLGCSGTIAQGCRTSAFLLDGEVLVDAGTGVGDLSIDEMLCVQHVLLTHTHLDHVAGLPLMLDSVASQRLARGLGPLTVYALPQTIVTLQAHVFNDHIWPNFTILPSAEQPLMRFQPIAVGQVLQVGAQTVEVLPAVHTVPAVGYAVASPSGHWVYSGDTGPNPAFWVRINELNVAMLIIETTFSNREHLVAESSLHLAPAGLASELDHIAAGRRYPIYITHSKPAETALIMEEVRRLDQAPVRTGDLPHDIRWLNAGMCFEL